MENALAVRLGRAGLRVPGVLWQRIAASQARRSAGGTGWMTPGHHRVRDFAVTEIVRTGKPLSPAQIAAGTGLGAGEAARLTGDLERAKTFLYRTGGINVDWAYPAAAAVTPHRVRLASGETLYAAWGIDAFALPFVQGQLTGRELTAVIGTACAHCSRPIRVEVTSSLRYQVQTLEAAPVISVPLVNFRRLEDPSIIHAFWQRSLFFWSEEHARDHRLGGRVAYPVLAQASALTGPAQSALFGFPREPRAWPAR